MAYVETEYGKFFFIKDDPIGEAIAQGKFWEEHLRPYMDRLEKSDVFVDVGANIGFFSVYCAKRGVRVHAFEPTDPVFSLLQRNCDVNGLTNVRFYHVALFDSRCPLMINPRWQDPNSLPDFEKMGNSGGLSLCPLGGLPVEKEISPMLPLFSGFALDSFLLHPVNLLKVDTQGADLRVLKGAIQTIRYYRPTILFEFEADESNTNGCGDTFGDFQSFFDDLKYSVKHLENVDYVAEAL